MSFILQPKVLARLFCRFRAISINGLDRSQFNQRPGSNQRPLGPGWRNSTITPKIRNSGKSIQPIWFISPLLVIQIRKPNILAATRSIMFCDVLAISLAVPAISLANWPMAFFGKATPYPMCRSDARKIKILPEGTIWPRSPSRLFCDLTMVRRRFEGFLMGCIGLFWL